MSYDLASMLKRSQPGRRVPAILPALQPPANASLELGAILVRFVGDWREAVIANVLAVYDPESDTAAETAARGFALAEGAAYVAAERTADRIRTWAVSLEQWHRKRWAQIVMNSTRLNVAPMLEPVSDRVKLAQQAVIAMMNDIDAGLASDLRGIVLRGLQVRLKRDLLRLAVRDLIRKAKVRAQVIATDQTARFAGTLDRERQEEAGLRSYEWAVGGKAHGHTALEGRRFTWAQGPADGPPGARALCTCSARAVIPVLFVGAEIR